MTSESRSTAPQGGQRLNSVLGGGSALGFAHWAHSGAYLWCSRKVCMEGSGHRPTARSHRHIHPPQRAPCCAQACLARCECQATRLAVVCAEEAMVSMYAIKSSSLCECLEIAHLPLDYMRALSCIVACDLSVRLVPSLPDLPARPMSGKSCSRVSYLTSTEVPASTSAVARPRCEKEPDAM